MKHWPADKVERKPIASLIPYARNARTHSDEQVAQIAASIREWGWTVPVLVDDDGGIIAGHCRVLAADKLGLADVPCMTATDWTDAQKRAYALADNRLSLSAGWDDDLLALELKGLAEWGFDLPLTGFNETEIAEFMADRSAGLTDPDDVPETPDDPVTVLGDTWRLGRHSIWCGSSSTDSAAKFFGRRDLVLTDPPYCSGGFQESGKSAGSVGTSGKHKQIVNDRLSTRGYQALMTRAIFTIDAPFFYTFTDWRMWLSLFDVSEAGGAGVRSMIVWNKQTPGMGRGWRAQHELIMWSGRKVAKYDKHMGGLGNVISLSRQPNILHTTQKPVELLETLLDGAPWVETVADPFLGSGSTLIACEKRGISCKGAELDPAYVDVAVKRWQEFTGETATLESTGEPFKANE